MHWREFVEEIEMFLDSLKDVNSTINIETDDNAVEMRLTVGGIIYRVFIGEED